MRKADPFPDIFLSPGLGQLTGPLLAHTHPEKLTIHKADKKTWYSNCVKTIHKAGLCNRPPTVWSNRLGANGAGPQWRVFYKPPLKKQTTDLQWRILFYMVLLPPMLLFLFLILLFLTPVHFVAFEKLFIMFLLSARG